MNIAYFMPQRIAPCGGLITQDGLLLTDGHTPFLYLFDIATARLMSKIALTRDICAICRDGDGYAALHGERELIYLAPSFAEKACVRIAEKANSLSLSSNGLPVICTCNGVFMLYRNGEIAERISKLPCIAYARSDSAAAFAYIKNGDAVIQVDARTANIDFNVPRFLIFRCFITSGPDIYGLFCYKYIYACLLPLFVGGLDKTGEYADKKAFFDLLRQ